MGFFRDERYSISFSKHISATKFNCPLPGLGLSLQKKFYVFMYYILLCLLMIRLNKTKKWNMNKWTHFDILGTFELSRITTNFIPILFKVRQLTSGSCLQYHGNNWRVNGTRVHLELFIFLIYDYIKFNTK